MTVATARPIFRGKPGWRSARCCQWDGSTGSGYPGSPPRAPGASHVRRTRLLHSPDVARPHRALDAGGGRRPYRTEIMDYATTLKAPAYLAINPMGKLPAITHGGAVVTEAAAVCAYLADAFPAAGLAPGGRRQGARALSSLAVLRRRSGRGGGHRQDARRRDQAGAEADGRLRRCGRHDERTGGRGERPRVHRRRQVQRGRRLRGLAARLGHAVRLDREAAGVRGVRGPASGPPGAAVRAREIDDKLLAEQRRRSRPTD